MNCDNPRWSFFTMGLVSLIFVIASINSQKSNLIFLTPPGRGLKRVTFVRIQHIFTQDTQQSRGILQPILSRRKVSSLEGLTKKRVTYYGNNLWENLWTFAKKFTKNYLEYWNPTVDSFCRPTQNCWQRVIKKARVAWIPTSLISHTYSREHFFFHTQG